MLPITHSAPQERATAIEVPTLTKRRLGLDDGQSWIVLSEVNIFNWPGPDLRPMAGGGLETVALGLLPNALFQKVRDGFLALHERNRARLVQRSE